MTRSCAGEAVAGCAPHAVSAVSDVSAVPPSVAQNDVGLVLHLAARLSVCAAAPGGPPHVQVTAVGGSDEQTRSQPVADLYDNGLSGDATAGDGVYERDVANPFFSTWPLGTTTLRFTGVVGLCYTPGPSATIEVVRASDGGDGP